MADDDPPRRPRHTNLFGTPYKPQTPAKRIPLGDITDEVLEREGRTAMNAANIEAGDEDTDSSDEEDADPEQTATTSTHAAHTTTTLAQAVATSLPLRTSPVRSPLTRTTPTRPSSAPIHGPSPANRNTPNRPSPLRQSLTAADTTQPSNAGEALYDMIASNVSAATTNETRKPPISFNNPFQPSPRVRSQSMQSGRSPLSAERRRLHAAMNRSPAGIKRRRTMSSPVSPGRQALQEEVDQGEEDFQENENMETWRHKQARYRGGDDEDDEMGGTT